MTSYDVLVAGGGPAGATAALRAARNGLRVALFEQARHPRFHVGESLLPQNMALLRELGLEERLREVQREPKLGASFVFGGDAEATHIRFSDGLSPGLHDTVNVERAGFDAMLFSAARDAGVETFEQTAVRRILALSDGDCRIETRDGQGAERTVAGRFLVDASGQGTLVGRHLGTRRTLPDLKKVAYFGHFNDVRRPEGERRGNPVIVMCDEGWFWLISLGDRRTSIGLVMDAGAAATVGVPSRRMLHWGIERCPFVRDRIDPAGVPVSCGVTADFSYTCRPYAGPGHFLVGDAATFVDPIFSTGVSLGMMAALQAADGIRDLVRGSRSAAGVQQAYREYVETTSAVFFRLVRGYYRHSFRELILNGRGPYQVHRALISALAGDVFPRPSFAMRWRLGLFELFVKLQESFKLVPRHAGHSLRRAKPVPLSRERMSNPCAGLAQT
jgi:flavin-dependent dehydrogenase